MRKEMFETGRVDCKCGHQIMSNSGKVISMMPDMVVCWSSKCGRVYSYNAIEKARKENKVVVFESPGKDLKVFKMNECDWWYDKSLEDAKKNYPIAIDTPPDECLEDPYELTEEQLQVLEYYHDDSYGADKSSFKEELQRMQSISDEPSFFASTEF